MAPFRLGVLLLLLLLLGFAWEGSAAATLLRGQEAPMEVHGQLAAGMRRDLKQSTGPVITRQTRCACTHGFNGATAIVSNNCSGVVTQRFILTSRGSNVVSLADIWGRCWDACHPNSASCSPSRTSKIYLVPCRSTSTTQRFQATLAQARANATSAMKWYNLRIGTSSGTMCVEVASGSALATNLLFQLNFCNDNSQQQQFNLPWL